MKYSFIKNSLLQILLSISSILVFILIMKVLDVEHFENVLVFIILYALITTSIIIISQIARQKRIKKLIDEFYNEMDFTAAYKLSNELGDDYKPLIKNIFYNQKNLLSKFEFNRSELISYRDLIEKWAHDIKTPLSASSLVLENNRDTIDGNLYQKLFLSNQQIKTKLDMILYYARFTSSKKDYHIKEINLSQALDNALIEFYPIIMEKELRIKNTLVDTYVISDYNTLVFILAQLISNSVKYADSEIVFEIESHDQIIFRISNDGPTLSNKDLAFIFEKSYTGSNSKKDESTGLGLYLVKSFADDLGIRVDVDDKFTIELIFDNTNNF